MGEHTVHEQLATLVRMHRKQSQLTQLELAQLAGVGKSVIYELEQGKPSLHFDNVLKVLHVLNITLHFSSPLLDEPS